MQVKQYLCFIEKHMYTVYSQLWKHADMTQLSPLDWIVVCFHNQCLGIHHGDAYRSD